MGGIEGFIEAFVDEILNNLASVAESWVQFAENCVNQIFGSIFQLVEVANEILSVVDSIQGIVETVGAIDSLSSLGDLANVTNIVGFILQLLGIGCNRDTDGPKQEDWDTCDVTAITAVHSISKLQIQFLVGGRQNIPRCLFKHLNLVTCLPWMTPLVLLD